MSLVVVLVILAFLFLGRMELNVAGRFKVIEEVQERQTITADIALPEWDIVDVKVGQRVVLNVFPKMAFSGQITSITSISAVDESGGRTRIVRSEIDNSLDLLEEEMTGTARVFLGRRRIFDLMTRRWWSFSDSSTASVPATANTPLSDTTEIPRSPQQGEEQIDEPTPSPTNQSDRVERSPAAGERPPTNQLGSTSIRAVGFAVQIAASRTRQNAEKSRTLWEGRGYAAYVVETDIPGSGHYYRVRVGRFDRQEEAREVASDIQRHFPQELPDFWIVPYQQ